MRVALVLSVAACVTPSPAPSGPARARLADLHASALSVGLWTDASNIWPPWTLTATLDTSGDGCPALARDAIATLKGVPLQLFDAKLHGESRGTGGCEPEQLVLSTDGAGDIGAFPSTPIQLVIADPSATWTFEFVAPNAAFVLSPEPLAPGVSTATWIDGPPLTNACVEIDRTDGLELQPCADSQATLRSDPPNAFDFTVSLDSPDVQFRALVTAIGAFELDGTDKACRGPVRCRLDARARATID